MITLQVARARVLFPGLICTRPVTDFIVNCFSHIAVETEVALKNIGSIWFLEEIVFEFWLT